MYSISKWSKPRLELKGSISRIRLCGETIRLTVVGRNKEQVQTTRKQTNDKMEAESLFKFWVYS